MSTSPDRYREVSVTDVDVPLDAAALRTLLMSRPVYRRTRYMVVRAAGRAALVEVVTGSTAPLFTAVEDVVLLAGPDETVYLQRPEVDTGVPSAVAQVAREVPGARCVVVEGRYGHVSFVLDAAPLVLHVLDVAPPHPAKLVDQVARVLATADHLPAVVTVPHVVELPDLLPWMRQVLDIELKANDTHAPAYPPAVPEAVENAAFLRELHVRFAQGAISAEPLLRLRHGHGHTLEAMYAIKYGRVERVPDLIVFPSTADDVTALVDIAGRHDVCLVPYGGGTNVTDALQCPVDERRMIVSVDLSRLNRILWIDPVNLMAA